jgi:hypothetical protein
VLEYVPSRPSSEYPSPSRQLKRKLNVNGNPVIAPVGPLAPRIDGKSLQSGVAAWLEVGIIAVINNIRNPIMENLLSELSIGGANHSGRLTRILEILQLIVCVRAGLASV